MGAYSGTRIGKKQALIGQTVRAGETGRTKSAEIILFGNYQITKPEESGFQAHLGKSNIMIHPFGGSFLNIVF